MTQKLYFICTDDKTPIGGIKQLYRQVDILNKNGFNAYIVHRKKGFRHKWFQNETKIIYNISIFNEINIFNKKTNLFKAFKNHIRARKETIIDENGILIIPEIYGPYITTLRNCMKKVIFNQNCFYTYNTCGIDESKKDPIYLNKNFMGSIVVSENSKTYLDYSFPSSINYRIFLGIDTSKFNYSKTTKKNKIAFMPRKLEEDIVQIINILKIRNNLDNWEFVSINNRTENEVATILNESLIFLSLNHKEGFGLPPAEAMASGCIVIGYAGHGGEEYFKDSFSFKINDGNIINFVKKIEEVTRKFDNNEPELFEMAQKASNYICENYNLKKEEESIVSTWNKILVNSNQ